MGWIFLESLPAKINLRWNNCDGSVFPVPHLSNNKSICIVTVECFFLSQPIKSVCTLVYLHYLQFKCSVSK